LEQIAPRETLFESNSAAFANEHVIFLSVLHRIGIECEYLFFEDVEALSPAVAQLDDVEMHVSVVVVLDMIAVYNHS